MVRKDIFRMTQPVCVPRTGRKELKRISIINDVLKKLMDSYNTTCLWIIRSSALKQTGRLTSGWAPLEEI